MARDRMVHGLRAVLDEKFRPENYAEFRNQAALLSDMLQVAVPLWVSELAELRRRTDDAVWWEEIQRISRACADVVAEKGDILMFRGKKRGETAAAFNALSQGVACMSFCPGGITLFGTHWEYKSERVKA